MFDLAVATGAGWDVDRMAEEMPLPLFWEWMAYSRLNPFFYGAYRQARVDWDFGMLAANLINVMSKMWAKRGTSFKAADFMFVDPSTGSGRGKKEKTPKELYNELKWGLIMMAGVEVAADGD